MFHCSLSIVGIFLDVFVASWLCKYIYFVRQVCEILILLKGARRRQKPKENRAINIIKKHRKGEMKWMISKGPSQKKKKKKA